MSNNEWKKVCAACAEGTPPKWCAYYGEPNGCNAPKTRQHPTAREELNKAANICLFVKENSGDAQTARYMAEAIVAINEAVAQETAKVEQPGNAAALREALTRIVNLAPEYPARGVDWNALAAEAFLTASSALAAPARNCDRFATEDEAREAYWAYREPLEFNDKPFVAITEWLFAEAKGGAE